MNITHFASKASLAPLVSVFARPVGVDKNGHLCWATPKWLSIMILNARS